MSAELTLRISPSHKWLILKALEYFTDDDSLEKFLKEFPQLDQKEMAEDLNELINRLSRMK